MSLTDQLLAALVLYGLPALFAMILFSSVGLPLPCGLLLVAAGSFVAQGEWTLGSVILVGTLAAVLGDHIGYGLARWGGRKLILRLSLRLGAEVDFRKMEASTRRWGGLGIFLSRWLFVALGPWANVASGIAAYPWRYFVVWDVLGELLWVVLYVTLGYIFSERVAALMEILASLSWVLLGLALAGLLGWQVWRSSRPVSPISP